MLMDSKFASYRDTEQLLGNSLNTPSLINVAKLSVLKRRAYNIYAKFKWSSELR